MTSIHHFGNAAAGLCRRISADHGNGIRKGRRRAFVTGGDL